MNEEKIIEKLEKRIEGLENKLKEHQHLGIDESKKFDVSNKITCEELEISGLDIAENMFAIPSFKVHDGGNKGEIRRTGSIAVGTSLKGQDKEQDNLVLQVGKGIVKQASNREDWDKNNFSQLLLVHEPNDYPWYLFGFKDLPQASYLVAKRTPIIFGTGVVKDDTLIDINADFPVGTAPLSRAEAMKYKNGVIHATCIIKDNNFNTIEANRIISSTKTSLHFKRNWDSPAGNYRYEILVPVILGSANIPFSVAYFGDGIILGYGTRTTNNKISTITWGSGSPEGSVFAAPGSLYVNQSGGTNTTLYVKESGVSNTGWKAK